VGYGIQWICYKLARYRSIYRDTAGYQGYGEIQAGTGTGEIQVGYPKSKKYTPEEGSRQREVECAEAEAMRMGICHNMPYVWR